jgi:hypothetical protein
VSETLGPFTFDAAEGVLRPAAGVIKTSIDPAPPTYDTGQAVGVESPILSVRRFATPALALAAALGYRTAIGATLTFRGVSCLVANVVPDHQTAKDSIGGAGAVASARWTLVASLSWVPV